MCSTVSVNAQKFQRLVHSISSLIIPRRRATSGLAELIWALAVRSTSHYRREEAFAVLLAAGPTFRMLIHQLMHLKPLMLQLLKSSCMTCPLSMDSSSKTRNHPEPAPQPAPQPARTTRSLLPNLLRNRLCKPLRTCSYVTDSRTIQNRNPLWTGWTGRSRIKEKKGMKQKE